MKSIVVTLFVSVYSFKSISQSSSLKVKIDKLRNEKGMVIAILYDKEKSYPKKVEQAVAIRLIKASECTSKEIEFNNLEQEKDYAVLVFHDENNDKDCNLNFLGLPKEGVGFSQNFRSRPKFNKGKFQLTSAVSSIGISMWYILPF